VEINSLKDIDKFSTVQRLVNLNADRKRIFEQLPKYYPLPGDAN